MSSSQFVCLICDATTDSVEKLQEHTRTHATKDKRAAKSKESTTVHKLGDRTPCDVCTEVFDTPTKAISHKFKKHPNFPNSCFCPWCGKQFPIKHILDKHTMSHKEPEAERLPCEHCDAFFFNVKAAEYHVTYFHKKEFMLANYIQTPPASFKIVSGSNGDLMSAYYCQYCGNEYCLKHNLRQHIKRVHMKANMSQPPEDMIQCKTCNALFFNVEAYDFHTTFHSDKDVFVISEEIRQQVISKIDQDFDARRVRIQDNRRRNPDTVMQMQLMSEIRAKMFSDIGNMSSLSPPPEDTDSDEDKEVEEDVSLKKQPAENAITIGEFFEMNKSLLGDCVETNVEDVEIQGRGITRKRSQRKEKDVEKITESKEHQGDVEDSAIEVKRMKREKHKKSNKDKTIEPQHNDSIFENKSPACKIFGSFKFLDLKVCLERLDFDSMVNKNGTYVIPKIKPKNVSELKPNKLNPVKTYNVKPTLKQTPASEDRSKSIVLPKNNSETANGRFVLKESQNEKVESTTSSVSNDRMPGKTLRKIPAPKDVSKLNVKVLSKKDLDDKIITNESVNGEVKSEILASEKSFNEMVTSLPSVKEDAVSKISTNGMKSEVSDSNVNGSLIKVVALSTLKDNSDKIPKKLIPVSSIPHNVKNVKMFRKVLVPKGVLKPGVKVLTKGELNDLEKKGLIVTSAPMTDAI